MRTEKDFLGEQRIPDTALYGIHSVRANVNFPYKFSFSLNWYKAVGVTKLAVYRSYRKYKQAALKKYPDKGKKINFINDEILNLLIETANEVSEGNYFEHFIVPAIQGGAGTSINLNVNEIIANASLVKMGKQPGDYSVIDPFEHANIFQSTNDVVPTSLKLTVLRLLLGLEDEINNLRSKIEFLEKENQTSLRIAYTQMQEAVPSSYGRLFSGYSEALSRDWWRISKCFERIKQVNLGGTAIGSGITAARFYIMEVVQELQRLTKLPITRAENLEDNTANLDTYVEILGVLKAHAVNLEKFANDLRLLSSDLLIDKDICIPMRQTGSSIMPGKVNPVISEYIISIAHKIYANDQLISSLSGQGILDLNPYLPAIGHALIESLELLIAANQSFNHNLISGISVNINAAAQKLYRSPAIVTALLPYIGYNKSALLAKMMKKQAIDVFAANKQIQLISDEKLKSILSIDNLLKTGFILNDLIK
ncbi:MAG: hypothetical protein L3J74_09835 [Bacteroidales bacterium]|nr:hypothetical protein [Bacteroidales bacterium]